MTRIRIGIPVRDRGDLLASTLDSLEGRCRDADVVLLMDGADSAVRAAVPANRACLVLGWERPRGLPACFNRLVESDDADVYVLLENGARVGPGWLDRLLGALAADPRHGLAGPSTNDCWNEQGAFARAGGAAHEIEHTALLAAQRYGDSIAYLEPLHSLAEFCYAVRREVIQTVGAADEGYGVGPCWEMDYNIRAARAGFRGVWVRGAYVWRAERTPQRRAEEAAWFETSRRRYQDRFCGLRLRGEKHDYEPHCKGDACRHFAPIERMSPAPEPARAREGGAETRAPLVSCLMPTRNRRRYVPGAIAAFLRQDYEPRELLIVDDGDEPVADLVPRDPRIRYLRETQRRSLGAKRNLACSRARGEILLHWDDDDWHAPWRVSYQVAELTAQQADLCGLSRLWFYEPESDRAWHYRYGGGRTRWVAGGTLCYRRALWDRHRFADVNVGEDTRFVREAASARIVALERDDFYLARVHDGNTSPKHTGGANWHARPSKLVRDMLGDDFEAFRSGHAPAGALHPLVTCIMPTFNRRPFLPLSLRVFAEQDYPSKELIVIDDGTQPVGDLVGGAAGVRYLRLAGRHSIGHKRNLACAQAAGDIILQWDDDDWYAPERITRQVEPILAGRAELTGIEGNLVMSMPSATFWALSPALHQRMFVGDVHGGTLAFAKKIWSADAQYPDSSLAEDAAFLRLAQRKGGRLVRIPNDGLFAYHRHECNAWHLQVGQHVDPRGWARTSAPERMPPELIAAYSEGARQLGRR